jgi:iron complex transport system permease protein
MTQLSDRPDPTAVPGRTPLRIGRVSLVWRARPVAVCVVALLLSAALAAISVARGDYPIPLVDVIETIFGGGSPSTRFIVLDLRMPRALTALLVGAALGAAGAITQAIARNPLASPDLLGVTDGAAVAAVLAIVVGGGSGAAAGELVTVGVPVAALAGGLAAALVVYALAYRRGIDGYRLVLVGIGVSAAAFSATSWLLIIAKVEQAGQVLVWLRGSLSGRDWGDVVPAGCAVAVLLPLALVLTFRLGVLSLDDDTARGLGVPINRSRAALVVVAVLLAATATACAGPLRFVALVAPQITQRVARTAVPPLLGSAAVGALLTVGADLLARTVLGDTQPAGIVTVLLGAPYLLFLIVRRNRRVTA